MDNYNYNYNNINNWSTYIGDKINRQTDRHNNSILDRINKKLESLEAIERSTTVERKNDRDNRIEIKLSQKLKGYNVLSKEKGYKITREGKAITKAFLKLGTLEA